MPENMKSVMVFDSNDTDTQTANKWINWIRDNKSAVGDKAVPNKAKTLEMLYGK